MPFKPLTRKVKIPSLGTSREDQIPTLGSSLMIKFLWLAQPLWIPQPYPNSNPPPPFGRTLTGALRHRCAGAYDWCSVTVG